MKRLLSAMLCAAMLISGFASAQGGTGISYSLPNGASMLTVSDVEAQQMPDGLKPMYELMQKASDKSITFVFRMKNGRALASVSISPVADGVSSSMLVSEWYAIAKTLSSEIAYVKTNDSCATLGERYGREALIINTSGAVGEQSSLLLDIGCVAIIEGGLLAEIWTVAPSKPVYATDSAEYSECEDDKRDMEALLASLNLSDLWGESSELQKPTVAYETERYIDPKGRFEANILKGCTILTAESTKGAAQKLRDALVLKYGAGAGALFDTNYADVLNEDATYITLPDLSGAACIYRVYSPALEHYTIKNLQQTAPSVVKGLTTKFGEAHCLYDDGTIHVAGAEHAWTAYWIRSGQTDILLNLIASVDAGGYLRELDIFTMTDDKANGLSDALMYELVNSIVYTIPKVEP